MAGGLTGAWNRRVILEHWLGLALLVIGYSVGTWAMAVNAFFSSHVRIQKDRGQTVVTTSPYAIVRHPAYITGAIAMCGIPLLLDSLLAFPFQAATKQKRRYLLR